MKEGMRELVVSRGPSGHVALYFFEEAEDRVFVLGIRHQRASGYPAVESIRFAARRSTTRFPTDT